MRQVARISIITAVAVGLAASLVPLPAVGGGCGSQSENQQTDPRAVPPRDPNLYIDTLLSQYEAAGDRLQKDVSDLEIRLMRLMENSGEARIGDQLTEMHMQVSSLRNDLSLYQDLGWSIIGSLAHQMDQQREDQLNSRTNAHHDHDI